MMLLLAPDNCVSHKIIYDTGSSIYSGIGGGCMLSSLINFPARQDKAALQNMDSKPVKIMDFYRSMLLHFHWHKTLISRIEEGTHEERVVKNNKNFKLAGVRCPIYSKQLQVGGHERSFKAASYQHRANSQYGFHNDIVSVERCLDKPAQLS